jgi:hypothetical protein
MQHFSGYGAYLLFLALRTHFNNTKYDFFQMHGRLRASKNSFEKRRDKFFFSKLAKVYNCEELRDFYVANLLKDKHYVTELLDDEAQKNYNEYIRRRQSLTYIFTNELSRVFLYDVMSPFKLIDGQYPYIVALYLQNIVSPETMAILDDFILYSNKFNKYLGTNDPIWSKVALKIHKYKPFIKYDKDKFKHILKEKIDENNIR